ncbi:hypothetical protein DITRI_Ditri01bG0185300 [Diplodiscus trichospermus]
MKEPLSSGQRAPMLNRLQTPISSFVLRSNNDQLERIQAQAAARAAAFRRSSILASRPPPPCPDPCISKDQIIELFQNCIKLASENKINQKNTWELKLIDHLSEIIKADTAEGDAETNFQKASCTLEARVKIYSYRVDALDADTYQVLGGIHRAGQEDQQDTIVKVDYVNKRKESSPNKKESEKKISLISTIESSFEAFNFRKFDVDSLYHQTSAQFDEGGAKGLLLNNLGIYEESIEKMVTNMLAKKEICPTLKVIECHFGGDNQRSSETFDIGQKRDFGVDAADANVAGLDNSFGNYDLWTFDNDEVSSVVNEGSNTHPAFYDQHEENDTYAYCEIDLEDRFEDVAKFLSQGLGFTSKQNAWAVSQDIPATNVESALTTKKSKSKNLKDVDVDFTKNLDKEMRDVFVPPKNPNLLLLPTKRAPCNNTLPEDCHYQPESLVKLFLLPNNVVM